MALPNTPDQPLDLSRHRPSNEKVYRPMEPDYSPPSDTESEDLSDLYSPDLSPETEEPDRPSRPATQRRPMPNLIVPKCRWYPQRPGPFPKREKQEPPPVSRNSPIQRNNASRPKNSWQPQNNSPGEQNDSSRPSMPTPCSHSCEC
ncbi:hypothetical protein TNIN_98641 [Trichonephila inaurata madagascariensis]|uniref:Uncharacterized protein n=1 Tax=Trichonephila inaurata madagascariensis TaxID=2747483 RepID=A0A8X6YDQ9_9ARAC|nr:hypothetical protein TNIN_147881 [Trichonephila inaurata madagascariensis]GFY68970.1 hypothetical protein TNIN_98641 [Trichonephila inaurata madagascariensis]